MVLFRASIFHPVAPGAALPRVHTPRARQDAPVRGIEHGTLSWSHAFIIR